MISLVVRVDRRSEQGLHGSWPERDRIEVDHRLQIAHLMRQAQLAFARRSFNLSRVAVADPDFGGGIGHDILDHIHAAVGANDMQNCCCRAKHPLPPVLSVHPAAGFVAMNDLTLLDLALDGFDLLPGLLTSTVHDLVATARNNLDAMQITQSRFRTDVAHVLFLTEIHHRRFQPGPKRPLHFQSFRSWFNLGLPTLWTVHLKLPYFDHFRFRIRQFCDLVHIDQLTHYPMQIGVAIRAHLCFQIHDVIRFGHKFALVFDMPLGRVHACSCGDSSPDCASNPATVAATSCSNLSAVSCSFPTSSAALRNPLSTAPTRLANLPTAHAPQAPDQSILHGSFEPSRLESL